VFFEFLLSRLDHSSSSRVEKMSQSDIASNLTAVGATNVASGGVGSGGVILSPTSPDSAGSGSGSGSGSGGGSGAPIGTDSQFQYAFDSFMVRNNSTTNRLTDGDAEEQTGTASITWTSGHTRNKTQRDYHATHSILSSRIFSSLLFSVCVVCVCVSLLLLFVHPSRLTFVSTTQPIDVIFSC